MYYIRRCDDVVLEAGTTYPASLPPGDEAEDFHKVYTLLLFMAKNVVS